MMFVQHGYWIESSFQEYVAENTLDDLLLVDVFVYSKACDDFVRRYRLATVEIDNVILAYLLISSIQAVLWCPVF